MQKYRDSHRRFRSELLALAPMLAVLAVPSCGPKPVDENAEAVAQLGETHVITLSGFRFQLPVEWTTTTSANDSRLVEATLPGRGNAADGSLIVYYFGEDGAGSVASNVARWCSQIESPDPTEVDARPTVAKHTIHDLTLHTVDAIGTYVAETAPGSGVFLNEPDQRLLAAIVLTDAGPYYFKALGPAVTMRSWLDAWKGVVASVEPAPVMADSSVVHP